MPKPSYTYTLDDATISTAETYVEKQRMAVVSEHSLLLGPLFNNGRMPGLAGEVPVIRGINAGSVRRVAGRELRMPVATGSSTNTSAFRGAALLSTNIDDVGTAQRAIYAYYTDFAAIALTEMWENSGSEAFLSLWQDRADQAVRSLTEAIEADLWGANTDTTVGSQEEVIGLRHLIPTDPTSGTLWGINRATYTWQRTNEVGDVSGAFSSVGLANWRTAMTVAAGTNGVDSPTAIYTTPAVWRGYAGAAEGKLQLQSARRADLGFDMLTYQGLPVFHSSNCLTGASYFVNHNYLKLFVPPGADFMVENYQSPPDQAIAFLRRIFLGIQWGLSRADRHAVVWGFTDT